MEILKDVIDNCRGSEFDRLRRLIRNFVLCCLERGSWTDDLEKPLAMEEFEVMYDNYPKWVRAPWEEGKREGILEGKREGILEGKREGEGAILSSLISSLSAKLSERFGSVPGSWAASLERLRDPRQIIALTGAAYTAQSPEEFEAALLELLQPQS